MLEKTIKTTKEHFRLFQSECEKWITFFGLYNWKVYYEHGASGDNYGETYYTITGKAAKITLNTTFPEKTESIIEQVKETAFHEVCELLLGKLNCLALGRIACNSDIVEEAIHDVIRTLEAKIYRGE